MKKQNKIKLIPYIEVDGMRTFTDTFVAHLYDRAVEDGTADTVFRNNNTDTREQFVFEMKTHKNLLHVIFYDDIACGFVILNKFDDKTAHGHFCLYKTLWGKHTIEVGKYCLETIINMRDAATSEYMLDCLIGVVPFNNTHALKFIQKIGMVPMGTIPNMAWNAKTNKSEAAVLSYYTRKD